MSRCWLPALALAFLLAGCGGTPYSVRDLDVRYDVALNVELSANAGAPGSPVIAAVEFSNRGSSAVFASYGCGSPVVSVFDESGNRVYWYDPRIVPACADNFGPMPAGLHMELARLNFTGELYTVNGEPYAAASGTYTVFASFPYTRTSSLPLDRVVESSATFTWSAP